MRNPFKYGEAVAGDNFTDREKEQKQIRSYIESAQNVFIFANRRIGKTSLIKKVLQDVARKKEAIAIYVDLEQVAAPAQFVQVYGNAISGALYLWREKMEKIAGFFSRIVPNFEITREGGIKVSFDFSKTKEKIQYALEEVYELPQKVALKYKKRVVVVFDEFQEIEKLGGIEFEKKLRSFIQHHSEVCYIFMGSKTRIIVQMFNNPSRAFYKSAATFPLGPISREEMIEFIVRKFAASKKRISNSLASQIVETSRNIPYYVQMLAWHTWNLSSIVAKEEDIAKAVEELLLSQNELFYNWYDNSSIHQRATLRALAKNAEIFSQEAIIQYSLNSPSSVQASLRKLLKSGLVVKEENKYNVADPFFLLWLNKN